MERDEFQEALLRTMESKEHWAWPHFTHGRVPKEKLHIHLEHEYGVYVRDFPVLVARVYVQCPIPEVRRELAENIYEEETGGLHAGRPHPELFLDYPKGLGMDLRRFEHIELLPGAARYRAFLDDATTRRGWSVGAAISILFVEGTSHERAVLDENAPPRPEPALEDHPLVKHYGLPIENLRLTKAHRQVEEDHRRAAWRVMLDHVPTSEHRNVIDVMGEAVKRWHAYRDDVAAACGLKR